MFSNLTQNASIQGWHKSESFWKLSYCVCVNCGLVFFILAPQRGLFIIRTATDWRNSTCAAVFLESAVCQKLIFF